MNKIYTEKQLNRLCKEYQKLLRIRDWNIHVSLVPEGEIQNASGCHNSDLGLMCSHIRICNEESFTPRHATPELNMKQVLLHELVHITLSALGPRDEDEVRHELWESGIDRIACALDSLIEDPIFHQGDDPGEKGTEGVDGERVVVHPQHSTMICPKCKELTQTDSDGKLKDDMCDGCRVKKQDKEKRLAQSRKCPHCKEMLYRDAYVYPDGTDYFEEPVTMCASCAKGFDNEEGLPYCDICEEQFESDEDWCVASKAKRVCVKCSKQISDGYTKIPAEGKPIGEPCDATEFYKITPKQAHFYANRYQCHSCKMWIEGMNMETYFHHNNPVKDHDSHLNLCKDCNATIGDEKVETPQQMPGSPRAG